MKRWVIGLAGLLAAGVAQSSVFVWDGGASTTNFGDQANWNPDGTTFTTADEYQITDGTSVGVGSNFSIGGFDLSGGSALTIGSGNTVTVNQNAITHLSSGTLTVDGALNFGVNRWDTTGTGGTMNIVVNGTSYGHGNFYTSSTMGLAITVNGMFDHLITSMGSIHGYSQTITVNNGGVFDVFNGVTLRSNLAAETAVYLAGGTMSFDADDTYTYSSLMRNGNDGIIFTDAASQLTLDGDRTTEVNTWITDGALSSTVGDMQVSYDSGLDQTLVTIPEPATLGLFVISSTVAFGMRKLSM